MMVSGEYRSIVEAAKEAFATEDAMAKLNWCEECHEVNLWTYWQGFKWYEKRPRIKYMLVGQDWGNPNRGNFAWNMPNIIRMNDGEQAYYFDKVPGRKRTITKTDQRLIELFDMLGDKDIENTRYDELFFTNFCLGYRTGKNSGGMKYEDLNTDINCKLFRDSVELIKPENIICLGEATYKVVLTALNIAVPKYSKFNDYVTTVCNNKAFITAHNTRILPSFHPGAYGVRNRENHFDRMIDDWKSYNK